VLILQHLMLLLLLLVPLAPLLPILLLQLLTQLGVDEVAVVLVVLAAPLLLRLRLLLLQALVSLQQVLLALLGDRLHGGHVAGRGRGRVGGCPAPADGGVQEGVVATEVQLVVGRMVCLLGGQDGRINGQLLVVDGYVRLGMLVVVVVAGIGIGIGIGMGTGAGLLLLLLTVDLGGHWNAGGGGVRRRWTAAERRLLGDRTVVGN